MIRIITLLKNSGVLIDGVSKTVKHEIIKQEGRFFSMLLETLACFNVGKHVNRRRSHKS